MTDQVTILRRAEALIEANAHLGITIAAVAASVGTSPRSLQHLFRRHRATTPTTYLRLVRLAGAHRDLLAARDQNGPTVSAIAAQWGFHNPGRFAGYYAALYGHHPRETLRGPLPAGEAIRDHRPIPPPLQLPYVPRHRLPPSRGDSEGEA